DRDRLALRLAGRVGEPVDDRETRLGEDTRGGIDRLLRARLVPVDQREGALLDTVLLEPGTSKHAGVLGLQDLVRIVVDRQMHVIADAAAEGAGRIAYHVSVGHGSLLRRVT